MKMTHKTNYNYYNMQNMSFVVTYKSDKDTVHFYKKKVHFRTKA